MMRYFSLIVLSFLMFSFNAVAQNKDILNLTNAFIDTVKSNAYSSANVNWDSVAPIIIKKSCGIKEAKDLLPLFKMVLSDLRDVHSSLQYHETDTSIKEDFMVQLRQMAKMTDADAGLPPKNYQSYMIDKKYAYINIPPVRLEQAKYIDTIGKQLKFLDDNNPQAWIIDLTENSGGANYPMIWHFASLIDVDYSYSDVLNTGEEKKISVVLKPEGEQAKQVYDILELDPKKRPPIKLKNTQVPIIILTSYYTASAAEAFLLHFKGQKNVITVGQKTYGLTSTNQYYEIGNNFSLDLTISVLKDRNGKKYKINEGVNPDFLLPFDHSNIKTTNQLLEAVINSKKDYIEKALEIISKPSNFSL